MMNEYKILTRDIFQSFKEVGIVNVCIVIYSDWKFNSPVTINAKILWKLLYLQFIDMNSLICYPMQHIFTAPQQYLGKVMFSEACICLSMGGVGVGNR